MTTTRYPLKNLLAASLLGLAVSTAAFAAPHGHDMMAGGWGGGHFMQRMLDRVNATPEQRAQIKAITDAAATERKAQFQANRGLHEQMMALFTQPAIDANAAEALRQQQMAQFDAASKRRLQTMLQVANVLTPEQRQQIAQEMAQRRDMRQRHQREQRALDAPKS